MKNRLLEPVYIITSVAFILTIISFIPDSFFLLKKVDFLSDLKSKSIPDNELKEKTANALKETNITTRNLSKTSFSNESEIDSFGTLNNFFEALSNSDRSKNVRIGYFGDSMIEGDLVTNDLRKILQKCFGGNGVGFVPITSIVANFRTSINHNFNDAWHGYNFAYNKPPSGVFCGLSGHVFLPFIGAKVSYRKSNEYSPFKTIKLFYSNQDSADLAIKIDSISLNKRLYSKDIVNEEVLSDTILSSKIDIEVKSATTLAFYGCSFENGHGLYLDNYSFRGNSGIPLSNIPISVYADFYKKLNYKLIILSYGLNVVGHDIKNYGTYEKAFEKVIEEIKKAMPNASILLISVGDKSYKSGDIWQTEPDIPRFVAMQKELAIKQKVAFWNLYEAMGGYNSMKGWVESTPSMANTDYTHPNYRGAKKIANLINDYLMKEYQNYLKKDSIQAQLLKLNK